MIRLKSVAEAVLGYNRRQQIGEVLQRFWNYGYSRFCPCCNAHLRRFKPFGLVPRPEASCPVCGSLERHRLIYLYMTQKTNLFDGQPKKILHVAPEAQLTALFQKENYLDYLSADLSSPHAMVKMDITEIQYPDESFDVIYCSHVLEHVPDDVKAMREFCRILKTGGWAVLQVPITAEQTFEDPSVTSPEERERLYGQHDHVRRYGPDYADRLVEAGFSVTVDRFTQTLSETEVRRFGLRADESVYVCRKQPGC